MAYIGWTETVSAKPTFAVEIGTGLVTIPNTQSNVLHFADKVNMSHCKDKKNNPHESICDKKPYC